MSVAHVFCLMAHRANVLPGVSWRVGIKAPGRAKSTFGLGKKVPLKQRPAIMRVTLKERRSVMKSPRNGAEQENSTPRDRLEAPDDEDTTQQMLLEVELIYCNMLQKPCVVHLFGLLPLTWVCTYIVHDSAQNVRNIGFSIQLHSTLQLF